MVRKRKKIFKEDVFIEGRRIRVRSRDLILPVSKKRIPKGIEIKMPKLEKILKKGKKKKRK